METLLQADDLNFQYPGQPFGLKNISFEVKKGDFVSIVGRNGSGKSTLIKCLAGIFFNYSGKVLFNDEDIRDIDKKSLAQHLSYLSQKGLEDIFDIKVKDFLLLGRFPFKDKFDFSYSKQDRDIVRDVIAKLKLEEYENKILNKLSGGERQKCLIGLSLVQLNLTGNLKNKMLIIDEPLTHLDIHHQKEIFDILSNLNKEKNLTVVTVIHDLNLALKYTNKTMLINNGELIKFDKPELVLTQENIEKYFLATTEIVNINNNNYIVL
ncbi:MAG TPA: ABC transporter ATP-binding protein [Ignavibacteria bacterium]|nr:ABC transporter ATP-binding protein [Ignavibacteria bacterium]